MSFRKIYKVRDALLQVSRDVWHYEAQRKKEKYIVWAEDSESSASLGDNNKSNQTIQGTIDYFTKTEEDENADKIQDALDTANIAYRLNSTQYEEETGYIHFEWVWEVT